jgi:hypothetical protein
VSLQFKYQGGMLVEVSGGDVLIMRGRVRRPGSHVD